MLTQNAPDLITVSQAAEMLRVNRATVTRWARSGKLIPSQKIPGSNGPYLFTHASVAHLAARRRNDGSKS